MAQDIAAGLPIDAEAMAACLLCLYQNDLAFSRAPVVLAEATPNAGNIFENAGNLLQSGSGVDSDTVDWFYLQDSVGQVGIRMTNGNGQVALIWEALGVAGPTDHLRLYSNNGDIYLQAVHATPIAQDPAVRMICAASVGGSSQMAFATDGYQTMSGDARPSITLAFGPGDMVLDGSNPPASGQTGSVAYLDFDPATDESVYFVCDIPDGWDVTSDPRAYVNWAPTSADTNTVTWALEITSPELTDDIATPELTYIKTQDGGGTADAYQQTGKIGLQAAVVDDCSVVYVRLFRDADASESGADDDYPDDARFVGIEIKFTLGAIGADARW